MEKRRVTIKDIARIARVTPTSVSMALNNRPRISEKTRANILRIAEELNYQPDLVARSLISGRSYTIGLIINNITDPFFPELAEGIEDTASQLGYSVILCKTKRDPRSEGRYIKSSAAGALTVLFAQPP